MCHWSLCRAGLRPERGRMILRAKMNDLLGPRQSAQIAVDDDPIEAVVDKEQQLTEKLLEQFQWELDSTPKLRDCPNN
jgi:hypothetical protein